MNIMPGLQGTQYVDDLIGYIDQLMSKIENGDLECQALTAALDRVPVGPGPSQGLYLHYAVGMEDLLELKDSSRRVVSIDGIGGIRKTTLATSVFNHSDLSCYCRVFVDQESRHSDLKEMQEQILNLELNNCIEGQEKLLESFERVCVPILLFIDNVLRDLEVFFLIEHPSYLHMSRILVTTRNLNEIGGIFGPIMAFKSILIE